MHHLQPVSVVFLVMVFLSQCPLRDTYDILALLPLVSPRNHQFDEAILMALARHGHRVTVYSQFPPEIPHPRYRHVPLAKHPKPDYDYFDRRWMSWKISDYAVLTAWNRERLYKFVNYVKTSEQFTYLQENLKSNKEHFDVIFTERLSGQEPLLLFAQWAKAPLVLLEPFGRNISTDLEYLLEPHQYSLALIYYLSNISAVKPFDDFQEKYIDYLNTAKTWRDNKLIQYKLPLEWKFTHSIMTYTNDIVVRNVTYPTVCASGIHINPSPPPLSEETQQFLDFAESVIVFDVGALISRYTTAITFLASNWQGIVVWTSNRKIYDYYGPYEPPLPGTLQQVLVHPKCKLLVTDGALVRIQEAIYYGVPVLVVPQSSAQNITAAYIKAAGMGEVLDPVECENHNILEKKVKEMINNEWFKKRADHLSKEYRCKTKGIESTVHHLLVKAMSETGLMAEDLSYPPDIKPEEDAVSGSISMSENTSRHPRTTPDGDAVLGSMSKDMNNSHYSRISGSMSTTDNTSQLPCITHEVVSVSGSMSTTVNNSHHPRITSNLDAVDGSMSKAENISIRFVLLAYLIQIYFILLSTHGFNAFCSLSGIVLFVLLFLISVHEICITDSVEIVAPFISIIDVDNELYASE